MPLSESRIVRCNLSQSGFLKCHDALVLGSPFGFGRVKCKFSHIGPAHNLEGRCRMASQDTKLAHGRVPRLSCVTTGCLMPARIKAFMLPFGLGMPNTSKQIICPFWPYSNPRSSDP